MVERRVIVVRGIVQGVGFRPYVYHLALRYRLGGFVKNRSGTVLIEIEGDGSALEQFVAELRANPPALAEIEHLSWESQLPQGEQEFRIEASDAAQANPIFISPDVASCPDCLAEMLDPSNRRYAYPFLNCTNCGPRLTIITGSPYDRQQTTMSAFPMCAACRAEYENPADRRFHAQPTACAACGPRLSALDANGCPVKSIDPLEDFVAAIKAGRIGALKGLGGYHLVCDATNAGSVAELRRRKRRDEKPFAIMVRNEIAAAKVCEFDERERQLLTSARRPIVLLRKRAPLAVAEAVAPRNPWLGVMLPYTPLHHLLLRAMDNVPLVMTSGNRSDEPIAYRDEEATEKLVGIADAFLIHDRPIHVRCDDSVTRTVAGSELPVRRSRGYAPRPIELPFECPLAILCWAGNSNRHSPSAGNGRPFSVIISGTWIISRLIRRSSRTSSFIRACFECGRRCWSMIYTPITRPRSMRTSALQTALDCSKFSTIMPI